MPREPRSGNFTISAAPVAPVAPASALPEEEAESYGGTPLLLAIPRNAKTLFVCWNVHWRVAFGDDLPRDRKAHVKLRSGAMEETHAIEPLTANCLIGDREPGVRYAVELGYYGANESWRVIVRGNEVTMPLLSRSGDEEVQVATIPFHLAFQRMLDVFGAIPGAAIADALAQLEERIVSEGGDEEDKILRALDLSADDLRKTMQRKQELTRIKPVPKKSRDFGGSSPISSSWQGS
jgi:hypothetical protein